MQTYSWCYLTDSVYNVIVGSAKLDEFPAKSEMKKAN